MSASRREERQRARLLGREAARLAVSSVVVSRAGRGALAVSECFGLRASAARGLAGAPCEWQGVMVCDFVRPRRGWECLRGRGSGRLCLAVSSVADCVVDQLALAMSRLVWEVAVVARRPGPNSWLYRRPDRSKSSALLRTPVLVFPSVELR